MKADECVQKRLLTPAKDRRGNKDETEKVGLTLEMESLLVHSDGECAVILVIYADHSSLGEQRWRERGKRERERGKRGRDGGSQSEKHVTPLFTFLIPSTRTFRPNKLDLIN